MRGMIARLLQRRDGRPILLGLCDRCRTEVFADEDFVRTALGYRHKECGHA